MASCECGRKWTGHTQAHCASCHEHFTSDKAFDKHLASPQSDDACYPPVDAERKDGTPALVQVTLATGPAWMVRDDREHPFSAAGRVQGSPNGELVGNAA